MSAKNKFLSTACLLGLACFALPSAAKADSWTVTITGTGGNAVGGVYVVPYYLTVVDGSQTSYISAICDDYIDEVKPPETWTGSIETFDASGNVIGGAGLFQGSVGNAGYDEAAWLYGQYLSKGTDPGGYNYAIWALFDPSIKTSGNPGNSGYASTDAAGPARKLQCLRFDGLQLFWLSNHYADELGWRCKPTAGIHLRSDADS